MYKVWGPLDHKNPSISGSTYANGAHRFAKFGFQSGGGDFKRFECAQLFYKILYHPNPFILHLQVLRLFNAPYFCELNSMADSNRQTTQYDDIHGGPVI